MNAQTPVSADEPLQSTADRPKPSLVRRLRPVLLLAALAGAGLGGNWWFRVGRHMEATDNAYVQGDIVLLGARIEGDVGAILVTGSTTEPVFVALGLVAIVLATVNMVGGFVVTDRMLQMFSRRRPPAASSGPRGQK